MGLKGPFFLSIPEIEQVAYFVEKLALYWDNRFSYNTLGLP